MNKINNYCIYNYKLLYTLLSQHDIKSHLSAIILWCKVYSQ